jgi:hypothetical protein
VHEQRNDYTKDRSSGKQDIKCELWDGYRGSEADQQPARNLEQALAPVWHFDFEQASGLKPRRFAHFTARLEAVPHKDLAIATQALWPNLVGVSLANGVAE